MKLVQELEGRAKGKDESYWAVEQMDEANAHKLQEIRNKMRKNTLKRAGVSR